MKFTLRGKTLYIRKRVPKRYASVDDREWLWLSLHTDSETVATKKAHAVWDEMIEAWEAKLAGAGAEAEDRMAAAKEYAARRGYRFMPGAEVARLPLPELLDRVEKTISTKGKPDKFAAEALLGGATPPKLTVSRALEKYWLIGKAKTIGKSEDQIRRWENPRKKAVGNFIEAVGDMDVAEINTGHLHEFRQWWVERLLAEKLTANSANKDFVHLLSVIRDVARVQMVPIDFDTKGLAIEDKDKRSRPPFKVEWIRDKLLAPGALDGLNAEARAILLGMINTGYRPSEGAMLTAAQIRLDDETPHISIEPVGRVLKSAHARRKIPLCGVSLAAFKEFPNGFPRYADNPSLSDTINKYLRENGLLPSTGHTMYSLRHSFEDRLLRAGVDERIRRDLMGHTLTRERYGDGADLAQVAELLKPLSL